jgi:hypothetical protein
MGVSPSTARRASRLALLGPLLVLLGACSNSATVVTTTTKPTTSTGVRITPGMIFVANGGMNLGAGAEGTGKGSVTAYSPGATGNARPTIVLTAGIVTPGSLAFDPSGDLWVLDPNGTVVEYSKAELAKASPTPTVTILSLSLISRKNIAVGLAFDPSGDLWVTKFERDAVEFTKTQLAESGSPAGRVTIHNDDLCSVAFDRSGDLWSGNPDTVFEFTRAQLAKSGSPAPRVSISSDSLSRPCRPTFDSSGDMWAANYDGSGGSTVVEFTKAQLAKSGSLTPWVTISSPSLESPGDVAFDSAGDLWVPNAGTNALFEYTKAQLTKSGSPTPASTIAGPATELNWVWAVAIDP